jgi:hypothetical protein
MRRIKRYELFLESTQHSVDFSSFPPSVLKTLDNEYGDYDRFDWNAMTDKYGYGEEFRRFIEENKQKKFIENLDSLIMKTTQDLIIKKREKLAEAKLKAFEELIKDSIGTEALTPALSKFEADALLDPYCTPESIEAAFQAAKNIIDEDGSIDQRKITPSEIFTGQDISLPNFERWAEKNPEYKGVFDDWKKLFDDYMEKSMKDLHAFRTSTSYESIKELNEFLKQYRKNMKAS